MGFQLNRIYELRWPEGDLAGLEIDIRSTSLGTQAKMRDADAAELAEILEAHIVRWNWDDIKPTSEGLLSLEEPVFNQIIREWWKAARGITAPLDLGSTSGTPSPVESIPMETP
jgi:hypothetical protein